MKAILKWETGKKQFTRDVIDKNYLFASNSKVDKEINNLYYFYVGGGSPLFTLLKMFKNKEKGYDLKILAYDPNPNLICFYHYLQKRPRKLWKKISLIQKIYNESEKEDKEKFYYAIRKLYNEIDFGLDFASFFFFLNQTCFKGIYRESKNGFNMPFGNYATINIQKDYFFEVSKLIKGVNFTTTLPSFETLKYRGNRKNEEIQNNIFIVEMPQNETEEMSEYLFNFLKFEENFLLKCSKSDLFFSFFNNGLYLIESLDKDKSKSKSKNKEDNFILVTPKSEGF